MVMILALAMAAVWAVSALLVLGMFAVDGLAHRRDALPAAVTMRDTALDDRLAGVHVIHAHAA